MQLSDISGLLSQSAQNYLEQGNNFEQIRASVVAFINELSNAGIEITTEFNGEWSWARIPFAWLAEYLCARRIGGASPEYWEQVEKNYQEAIKIVREKPRGQSKWIVDKIEGIYELPRSG